MQVPDNHAEAIRRQYIAHESAIRGLGTLLSFAGLLALLVVLPLSVWLIADRSLEPIYKILPLGALFWALASVWGAIDMRRVIPRARATGTVVCAFLFLMQPIGIPLAIYGLYLLHSAAGKFILDAKYNEVRLQTPQIRPTTPRSFRIIAAVCGVAFVVYVGLAIWLASFMGPVR